jgi:hypothetical protein
MAFRNLTIALAVLGASTAGVTALAAVEGLPPPPPGPGLDLINERCGFCHTTAQTLDVRKTPEKWAETVQSMIDRGAELTPEEQELMVQYLATNRAADPDGATHVSVEGAAPSATLAHR